MRLSLPLALTVVFAACRREVAAGIQGAGTIAIVEVDVSPLVPARVTRVWRQEGDRVRAGEPLVTLTQSTTLADIDTRRARLAAADAQLRELTAGSRPSEIARAQAALRAGQA